jgi:hypothetical protein
VKAAVSDQFHERRTKGQTVQSIKQITISYDTYFIKNTSNSSITTKATMTENPKTNKLEADQNPKDVLAVRRVRWEQKGP